MASGPSMLIRIAANVEELKRNLQEGRNQIEATTAGMKKLASSLEGNKLIQNAHNIVAAVNQIGGATKLTEAEKQRLNATLTKAVEKYRVLGKEAPSAMVALEQATRKAEQPTSFLTTKMVALGSAIGSFIGNIGANAVQAIGQKFVEAASNGAKFSALSDSFERLTRSIGQSGDAMLSMTRSATKGLITDLDIMQSSNKAILLGLPVTSGEMSKLAQTAVTLGRAMGQDATKSLDDLITALGRSSPMILDNLGLTVKLGEANDAYAQKLGKTSSQLTDAEKKMAFYEAAMSAASKKLDELGDIQLGVIDQLGRLGTSLSNAITAMSASANEANLVAQALGKIADAADRAATRSRDLAEAHRRLRDENVLASPRDVALQRTYEALNWGQAGPMTQRRADLLQIDRLTRIAAEGMPGMKMAPGLTLMPTMPGGGALFGGEHVLEAFSRTVGESARKAAAELERLARAAEELANMRSELRALEGSDSAGQALFGIVDSKRFMNGVAPLHTLLGDDPRGGSALMAGNINRLLHRMQIPGADFAAGANQNISQFPPGFFGRIGGSLSSMWNGMTGVDAGGKSLGMSGLFSNIGAGILTGGLSSLMNMGMGLVTKGLGKLFGGLFGGGEHSKVNDQRDQFFAQFGGQAGLIEAGLGDKEMRALFDAKTMKQWEAAVKQAQQAMSDAAEEANRLNAAIAKYNVQWTDFQGEKQVEKFNEALKVVNGEFDALTEAGLSHETALRKVKDGYLNLAMQAVQAGQDIPAALAPTLLQLAEMGELTEAQAAALLNMGQQAGPSFEQVMEVAGRYNLTLDEMGEKVQQLGVSDSAKKLEADFKLLMDAGANTREVITGMSDSVNDMIHRSLAMGLEVPASMRDMLQKFLEAGELTDENGQKLTDLSRINFAEPIQDAMRALIETLKELIAHIQTAGTGLANLPAVPSVPAAPEPGVDGPIPMAAGGAGVVTRPTLFLAGEAGREEFAFSGAGRSFGGGGSDALSRQILRAIEDQPRQFIAALQILRGQGSSYAA